MLLKIDNDLILNIDDDVIQHGRRACAERGGKETSILLCRKNVTFWNYGTFTLASSVEDVPVIFKWNDMQSFGKSLVDLYKHEFCITESYFQN